MIIDPKTPQRRDLEEICRGNQRLVKAFEKLFELVPSQFNKNSDDTSDAQVSADNAAAQALLAASLLMAMQTKVQMSALHPAAAEIHRDALSLAPAYEHTQAVQFTPTYEQSSCFNYNLEYT